MICLLSYHNRQWRSIHAGAENDTKDTHNLFPLREGVCPDHNPYNYRSHKEQLSRQNLHNFKLQTNANRKYFLEGKKKKSLRRVTGKFRF